MLSTVKKEWVLSAVRTLNQILYVDINKFCNIKKYSDVNVFANA